DCHRGACASAAVSRGHLRWPIAAGRSDDPAPLLLLVSGRVAALGDWFISVSFFNKGFPCLTPPFPPGLPLLRKKPTRHVMCCFPTRSTTGQARKAVSSRRSLPLGLIPN